MIHKERIINLIRLILIMERIFRFKLIVGVVLVLVLLVLPLFFDWTPNNAYLKIISIILWIFLIGVILVEFIIPKKYRKKAGEFLENMIDKLLGNLN